MILIFNEKFLAPSKCLLKIESCYLFSERFIHSTSTIRYTAHVFLSRHDFSSYMTDPADSLYVYVPPTASSDFSPTVGTTGILPCLL